MKKLLFTLFTFGYVLAMAQSTATLTIADVQATSIGEEVIVPITLDASTLPNDNCLSFLISVLYDPAHVSIAAGDWQNLYPTANPSYYSDNVVNGEDYRGNWLDFLTLSTFTIPAGSTLIELKFTTLTDQGSALSFAISKKVENNYAIKQATELLDENFTNAVLTLNDGSIFFSAVGTPGLWTGAVSSDWFDAGNWDDGNVPDEFTDVEIPFGTPNDPVIVTNDVTPEVAVAANLQMDAATMIVGPLGYLTVTGTVTNSGFIGVISDVDNSGSFINNGPVGGTFNYWRFVSNDAGEEFGWHYISAPTDGFTTDDMNDYYVNAWDEATSMWMNYGYDPITDPCTVWPTTPLTGLDGWSVKWDELYPYAICPGSPAGTGTVLEFTGAPNFGDQAGAVTNTGVGLYPGFNLVGNPYPSYWDYDAFFFGPNFPAGLFDAIYYYDASTAQYASYVNGIGTNGGSGFVPPGQAFFLEAAVDEPLLFTAAEQVHVIGLPFWKDAENTVKLMASANGFTDETVIRFSEDFTTARDKSDARKLISSSASVPSLYTMASNIAISINGMPAVETVPVFFECGTSGTYTIEAIETSDFSYIVLEDLLMGTETNLLEGSYTFDHTSGAEEGRFVLHFNALGIGDNAAANVEIWSNENNIYVNVPESLMGTISVYNLMGQEVVSTDTELGTNVIPMDNTNTYYVVKVLSNTNAVTGKVYIK